MRFRSFRSGKSDLGDRSYNTRRISEHSGTLTPVTAILGDYPGLYFYGRKALKEFRQAALLISVLVFTFCLAHPTPVLGVELPAEAGLVTARASGILNVTHDVVAIRGRLVGLDTRELRSGASHNIFVNDPMLASIATCNWLYESIFFDEKYFSRIRVGADVSPNFSHQGINIPCVHKDKSNGRNIVTDTWFERAGYDSGAILSPEFIVRKSHGGAGNAPQRERKQGHEERCDSSDCAVVVLSNDTFADYEGADAIIQIGLFIFAGSLIPLMYACAIRR